MYSQWPFTSHDLELSTCQVWWQNSSPSGWQSPRHQSWEQSADMSHPPPDSCVVSRDTELQKCLRKSPTKWNWQLNYHVLLQIASELLHFMPAVSPAVSAFWRHAKMLLSGRQISMWLPDFCTRASAEVSTKPAAKRSRKVNCNKVSSHGPNPKRKNCQKKSITQCTTASKANQSSYWCV